VGRDKGGFEPATKPKPYNAAQKYRWKIDRGRKKRRGRGKIQKKKV